MENIFLGAFVTMVGITLLYCGISIIQLCRKPTSNYKSPYFAKLERDNRRRDDIIYGLLKRLYLVAIEEEFEGSRYHYRAISLFNKKELEEKTKLESKENIEKLVCNRINYVKED